jgi:hypothetical protein
MPKNEELNDALSTLSTTSVLPESAGETVLSRLEARLGGTAPKEETAETEDDEASDETSAEGDEDPTDGEETEEEDETSEDDGEEESDDEESDEEAVELTEEQLAIALGLPEGSTKVDEEGNTLIRTKVDGKVDFVPLKDITASYQMEKHLQEKIRTVAEDKKQFEQVKTTETGKLQTAVTEAVSMMQSMEQQMFSEYQGVDFNAIKRDDPGRWSAMQHDIAQKQQQLGQVKGKLGQIIQAQQQEQLATTENEKKAKILAETELLVDKLPSWANPETAATEIKTLIPIAEQLGFTEDEVYALDDHRMVLLLRMASKAQGVEETTSIVKKKLKSIPKITKPGAKPSTTSKKSDRDKAQRISRLKQSGSPEDLRSAILDRL